jgi:hypothetical protein
MRKNMHAFIVVGIIIVLAANLLFLINFFENSLNFGESGVLVGIMLSGLFLIFLILISAVLLYFVYKNIIGMKIIVFLFIILVVVLSGFIIFSLINMPLRGSTIYEFDRKPDQIKIFDSYICWLSDNEIYLFNLVDTSLSSVGSATYGPIIYEGQVFFENNNLIYQYMISTEETNQITTGSGVSLDASGEFIVWFENNDIYLFNVTNESKKIINVDNVTLPLLVSDNFIVWREYIKPIADDCWKFWFGENVADSGNWDSSGVYDVWFYNISSGTKTKILTNIDQLVYDDTSVIDLYNHTIAYTNNLSIYTYDILTGENTEIVKHSKSNEIQKNTEWKSGYIRDLFLSGTIIVYGEHYSELFRYNGYTYRFFDLSNENQANLNLWVSDIYHNKIIGWPLKSNNFSNKGYELHLIELK